MNICLVTPAPARSRKGNRITALRWARILRSLGHRVRIEQQYRGQRCDAMIALHARRSFASVERFRSRHPALPLIVALTGTDLYGDIRTDAQARRSLELASRLVLLQPLGIRELPPHLRNKARVIFQSAQIEARKAAQKAGPQAARRASHRKHVFEVCVMGHLRPVKDPFRAAMAARLLPASSRIHVVQIGGALSKEMAKEAREEMRSNPRYRWLGELPQGKALRRLARSRLLVLSSLMEGGANVISEAIVAAVPVVSSRIPGSIGLLGPDYPGYFPVGDTRALARLLERAETDSRFLDTLQARCRRLKPLFRPAREAQAWKHLLRELSVPGAANRERP